MGFEVKLIKPTRLLTGKYAVFRIERRCNQNRKETEAQPAVRDIARAKARTKVTELTGGT